MNTVPDLFSSAVKKYSTKTAVVEDDGKITYGELYSGVLSFSSFLSTQGIKQGDRVAILLPNSIEFIVSFFSIASIGAVSVPINPAYKEEEIKFYVSHSEAKLVLTEERLKTIAEKAASESGASVIVIKGQQAEWSHSQSSINEKNETEIKQDYEAIYLYSTGSTGRPKRVARTHFNLIALADNHTSTVGWTDEDRVLFTVPISHTYGFGNFISSVKVGACIHVLGEFNRNRVIDIIEKESITVFPAVPFMLSVMADTFLPKPRDFSSLKIILSAGAPLPQETFYKFHEKFGVYPRQLYGSTETGVISINLSPDIKNMSHSVGRAVKNVEVKVLREDGTKADVNEVGEITVKSPSMTTTGYYGLPEETGKVFKNGYYFTGDLGRVDEDGYIFIVGRKKLFINISGNKIDPLEVENLILKHPKVREAAVLGVQDTAGNEAVKAVIVPKEHMERKEIVEFLKDKISDFKIPRIIEFRDEIPKSPTGKILREKLK